MLLSQEFSGYSDNFIWVCFLQTGELTHIMAGENLSSTDLHLACNDTLLVGQVAEMTQIDPTDTMATNRLHHRKLQVRWRHLVSRHLLKIYSSVLTFTLQRAYFFL